MIPLLYQLSYTATRTGEIRDTGTGCQGDRPAG
jgi:hypothetical protein